MEDGACAGESLGDREGAGEVEAVGGVGSVRGDVFATCADCATEGAGGCAGEGAGGFAGEGAGIATAMRGGVADLLFDAAAAAASAPPEVVGSNLAAGRARGDGREGSCGGIDCGCGVMVVGGGGEGE